MLYSQKDFVQACTMEKINKLLSEGAMSKRLILAQMHYLLAIIQVLYISFKNC